MSLESFQTICFHISPMRNDNHFMGLLTSTMENNRSKRPAENALYMTIGSSLNVSEINSNYVLNKSVV